jgi:hypothetical protein
MIRIWTGSGWLELPISPLVATGVNKLKPIILAPPSPGSTAEQVEEWLRGALKA